ncbi:MAG TPA: hypothetical protein ENL34_07410 [Chloroflexi bacterium]|nr:hypothetical protein [Chloroflexota bacterium]
MWGTCGTASFDWHLPNLLCGWAAAHSGEPMGTAMALSGADLPATGMCHHTYTLDANPSPDNRDHVEAKLSFMCAVRHEPKSPTDAGAVCFRSLSPEPVTAMPVVPLAKRIGPAPSL